MPPPDWVPAQVNTQTVRDVFTRTRLREINSSSSRGVLLEQSLEVLRTHVRELRKAGRDKLLEQFIRLTENLQRAPLTINFKAPSWFLAENKHTSYAQMYEKATQGGKEKMRLDNSDPKNPARIRVAADDLVTFPKGWMETRVVNPMSGATVRTLNMAQPPARGLSPDFARGRIVERMSPGNLTALHTMRNGQVVHDNVTDRNQEYEAGNLQFNPATKQLFAALNYGARPHGSTTRYGLSYFKLRDRFKNHAVFFAGDTFLALTGQARNTADDQVSYDMLGALIAKADGVLLEALLDGALRGHKLPDGDAALQEQLLVEAHLFEPLLFSGGLAEMYISTRDIEVTEWHNNVPSTRQASPDERYRIGVNARKFAHVHGVPLQFID